jgi:hypothetical protein
MNRRATRQSSSKAVLRQLGICTWLAVLAACDASDPVADSRCQCAVELSVARGVQQTFYVALDGDDAARGTRAGPFRTIARAQQAVRALAPKMFGDLVVYIEPGDYLLDEPLVFTEADSGRNGYKIVYRAAGGPDSARLLGGYRITDWTPYAGSIMTAQLPRGEPFYTLYENGARADEARNPNRITSAQLPMSRAAYFTTLAGSHRFMQVAPGDLQMLQGDLSSLRVVIWPFDGRAWFTDVVPVTAIDKATGHVELREETRYEIGAGARYFLQGALAFLDAPGEFFLDTSSATLYYWPRTTPNEIIVPTLRTLLAIRGSSPTTPVHDLVFRDLHFSATDFTEWYRFGWIEAGQSSESHQVPSFDRQIEMPPNRVGLVTMENTRQVDIVYSHISNAGYAGLYLLFANDHDCICGNLIEHTGGNGITVQGRYPGEGDVARSNVLSNNVIDHVGELIGNAAGIHILNSGYNEVSYSRIHDSPRFGVVISANAETPGELLYAQGNTVDHVRIEDVCQDSGDIGALYTWGLSVAGTEPRVNRFTQVIVNGAISDPSMRDTAPNGVYVDEDSGVQHFEDIRVDNTAGDSYRLHDSPPQSLANVSWQPGYDDRLLDHAHIGVREDFPAAYLSK